jgi:hypothetical protein
MTLNIVPTDAAALLDRQGSNSKQAELFHKLIYPLTVTEIKNNESRERLVGKFI